jgi:hypothetical protein
MEPMAGVTTATAVFATESFPTARNKPENGKDAFHNLLKKCGTPKHFAWNKNGTGAVGTDKGSVSAETGAAQNHLHARRSHKGNESIPAESQVHQNGHALGVWVMPRLKSKSRNQLRRLGTRESFHCL